MLAYSSKNFDFIAIFPFSLHLLFSSLLAFLFSSLCFSSPFSRVADVISDVMSGILFVILLSYAVTIAVCLVGLEIVEPFGVAFFGLIASISSLLTQMVIYCAFSENMTNDLYSTGDLFYESPWYRLSPTLQKLYILPIARLHREFRLTGLGIIECSLRIFASVKPLRFYF